VARYDKYEPNVGGFRAPLAADLPATEKTGNGNGIAVGIDGNGRVVLTAGTSGVAGVLCTTRDMKAGDVVDVMTSGEIVEWAGAVAGAVVTLLTVKVGWTVEATRLIVRLGALA
jgi:hypothetical protein